jgi:hypothetical protein
MSLCITGMPESPSRLAHRMVRDGWAAEALPDHKMSTEYVTTSAYAR